VSKNLFPHNGFPIRLEHKKETTVFYFQCKEHLTSYLKRYKLKKNQITIMEKPDEKL